MRRFIRWVFNFAAAVSAVLFLATCALWVRSGIVGDEWGWYQSSTQFYYTFVSASGRFQLDWVDTSLDDDSYYYNPVGYSPIPSTVNLATNLGGSVHYRLPGIEFERFASREMTAAVHYAIPAVLTLPLPFMRLRLLRRSRCKPQKGICPHCGYDLRATPDLCPECGVPPGATRTA
jgi:hypothetical protein